MGEHDNVCINADKRLGQADVRTQNPGLNRGGKAKIANIKATKDCGFKRGLLGVVECGQSGNGGSVSLALVWRVVCQKYK
jgi:hypothetical protein